MNITHRRVSIHLVWAHKHFCSSDFFTETKVVSCPSNQTSRAVPTSSPVGAGRVCVVTVLWLAAVVRGVWLVFIDSSRHWEAVYRDWSWSTNTHTHRQAQTNKNKAMGSLETSKRTHTHTLHATQSVDHICFSLIFKSQLRSGAPRYDSLRFLFDK